MSMEDGARAIIVEDGGEDGLSFEIDTTLYSMLAVQKTLYWFTDRCFVFLKPLGNHLQVRIRAKNEVLDLAVVRDEFCNALLDQSLRERISKETEPLRNLIMAHALSKTSLIDPQFEEEVPENDRFGISRPDRCSTDADA